MGATILEKGVSPDELHSEQDILHSLPVSQVQLVMKKCNNIKQAMGNSFRYLSPNRKKKYHECVWLLKRT